MNRWRMLLVCMTVAACQVEPTTANEATQELSSCTTSQSYCGAKMPAIPYYQGQQVPVANPKQRFTSYENAQGEWVFVLVDTSVRKVTWGTRIKKSDAAPLLYQVSLNGQVDIVRPPPTPPGGTDWLAAFLLARADVAGQANEAATAAVEQCPVK